MIVVVVITITCTVAIAFYLRSSTRTSAASPPVANYRPARDDERCGKALIDDIYPDRKLGQVYSRDCFEAALGLIPATGVLGYTTVKEDIVAAYDRQTGRSST